MTASSLIERLRAIQSYREPCVGEAASTLEDQARLIGECREVMDAMLVFFETSHQGRHSKRIVQALLTKLNAFGERG